MDINKKIQAASHSGARLRVIQDGPDYLVEKSISSAIEKNFLGIQKQQVFKPLPTPSFDIRAIPVLHTDKSAKCLTIMMPYIEGLGGERVAYRGSKTVAKNLKTALDFYLLNSIAASEDSCYPVAAIHDKLASIKAGLVGKDHLFPRLAEQIRQFEAFCQSDLCLPLGECHGDLTLANLKVTEENQLYLFDFLSCEINSPLQDAAKIIQDFEYGWSFRKEKESIRIKGEIFCEYAYPSFLKTLERLFWYEMRVIETLTLLRIAPYIDEHDQITVDWFNRVMVMSTNKLAR
ncbi:phosphotransferase [Vibrio fluvialis]|uniref:phosphotransferase family protein n=1 Tax=Vibrio fluvialis TaxID=676 RepID=UPI00192BA925|nr:phosphotransferase [Vibrio fluvialis]MBL4280019.1 phosphotransferase [Vibrio fluvialis]